MNFFKACFTPNTKADFDYETIEKVQNPHQKLYREADGDNINLRESDMVPNIL